MDGPPPSGGIPIRLRPHKSAWYTSVRLDLILEVSKSIRSRMVLLVPPVGRTTKFRNYETLDLSSDLNNLVHIYHIMIYMVNH